MNLTYNGYKVKSQALKDLSWLVGLIIKMNDRDIDYLTGDDYKKLFTVLGYSK